MAKRTEFQKQVAVALAEQTAIYPDKITFRANGTVEVRRGYYYRHGATADSWAARVQAALEGQGVAVVVISTDEYRRWPKDSYFCATVHPRA